MNKIFDVKAIWEYLPKILEGLPVTLGLTVVAMVLGVVLGFGMAIARIRKIPVLRQFCSVYLSFVRGVPLMVLLYLSYFGAGRALLEGVSGCVEDVPGYQPVG